MARMKRWAIAVQHKDIGNSLFVGNIMLTALHKAGAHIRTSTDSSFYPQGYTFVAILEESHCVLSTWPERNYGEIDLGCCSPNAEIILENLMAELTERGFCPLLIP